MDDEKKKREQQETLLRIRDAIVAHWLRHAEGPDVREIAERMQMSVGRVSAALKSTERFTGGGIADSRVPGCETHPGSSYGGRGNGSYPTRWTPTIAYLRALVRGEGSYEHEWSVRLSVPESSWSRKFAFAIIAFTEEDAIAEAKRRVTAEMKKAPHFNSRIEVEWRGRHFPGSADEIKAAVERHEAHAHAVLKQNVNQ